MESTGTDPSGSDDVGRARRVLREVFGFADYRGSQEPVITRALAGRDSIVLMPTGGGKSLCYQVPALVRPGVGIVVSPLIALMQDQVDALRQLGVRAAFWNSTLTPQQHAAVRRDLLAGTLDLLYVAPERLLLPDVLDLLDRVHAGPGLALLAIDEAHCVSQWGHDFRPEYLRLAPLGERFRGVPRLALTATADATTRAEIRHRLALGDAEEFVASFDRPNIRYTVVPKAKPREQLLRFLAQGGPGGASLRGEAGIVYCLSRASVEDTAAWLAARGVPAVAYHAGLDAGVRRDVQQRFRREEGLVVVATIAFGMGIDKPDVRFVAHLDLPRSLEGYYQETGRAGRDGAPAQAWMAYGLSDVVQQRGFIDRSEAPVEQRRVERARLEAMLGYCEAATCRRVVLLSYFGEDSQPCGNCDTCLQPPVTWDATIEAQKAMSAIVRTGERFGSGHVIDVLRGRRTPKVEQWQHDRLPTFGVGADLDQRAWSEVLRQLVVQGLVVADAGAYGALRLTASARPVLAGETRVHLRRLVPTAPDAGSAGAGRAQGRRARGSAGAPPAAGPISAEDEAAFQHLRALRRAIADEQGVPAYVVLPDATLRALVRQRPRDLATLLEVPGIGAVKADRYGERFLAALAEALPA